MADAGHRIFGSRRIPLYVQLAELFRQRVNRGVWPAGSVLPTIDQLMEQFDVARVTVRQAVALLAEEGLLSPQRGRGTFVSGHVGNHRKLKVQTTLADLVAMYDGDRPDHATLAEGIASPLISDSDGRAAPKYFHIRRVHSRNGEPYCLISVYIDYRIYRRAPTRFRRQLALPILTSLPGLKIASARQKLTVSTADVEAANLLGISINAPVADVRRVLCAPYRTVIYLAEVSYRGDYIHLEMDLKP